MGRSRFPLAPVSLFFLAGAGVLLFFVVLSSITRTTPLRQTYFLSADTSGISGARDVSQWTYFRICGEGNMDCSRSWPNAPVGYAWSKNPTGANLPRKLIGGYGNGTTSEQYFYLWRFGWVFYLLALVFTVFAFLSGFLACFGRLGHAIAGLMSLLALFFHSVGAALMTATFVRMRDEFTRAGRSAHIGVWAFGFTWGAWAAIFIATVLFCLGVRSKSDDHVSSSGSRWGRKRSVRSRRSYDVGNHRVKDEYA
ncbi:SUR7/PalI family-domain-containing protein [Astrocystis sublimbata]|nr:SUR7/PalI family-domain-containing protein [Astrocystis sublimbata]